MISGTPRTNSMKPTDTQRTIGIFERRPSASRMPIGNEPVMPTVATTSVTSSPPHNDVSTWGNPNTPPTSRKNASTGKTANT